MTATAPPATQLLVGQLQLEEESLARAEELLADPQIDERLRAAVQVRFAALFERRRRALDALRALLDAGGDDLGPAWRSLRSARQDNLGLLRQYLAFLQGALMRSAGLDGGVCALADHLLGELRAKTDLRWSRLTILAEGELLEVSTEIIKLRFPQVGIWRLPLMAHEFGHVVVGQLEVADPGGLTASKPLQLFVDRSEDRGLKLRLRELCSDVFAVYAMGPAFACNAILLEFDPSSSDEERSDAAHPSDSKRAEVILNALRRLDDPRDRFNKPMANIADGLAELWRMGRLNAEKTEELGQEAQGELEVWLELVWSALSEGLPTAVYDSRSFARAQRLEQVLSAGHGNPAVVADGDGLVEVLNAAWLARLSGRHAAVDDLGHRAADLAKSVLDRGPVR